MANGNQANTTSLKDLFDLFEKHISKTMKCAELAVVEKIEDGQILCSLIVNKEVRFECRKLKNVEIQVDDVVLVLFTDNDFRTSYNIYKNDKTKDRTFNTDNYHNILYGIIIGGIE